MTALPVPYTRRRLRAQFAVRRGLEPALRLLAGHPVSETPATHKAAADGDGTGAWTREKVAERVRGQEVYSPVDFGRLGWMGDIADVEVGEGRWRWLLRDLTDWRGKKTLDLGANNGLYALRQLQMGTEEVHCVEMDPYYHDQAQFVKSVIEQEEGRTLNARLHLADILSFLEGHPFPDEYFDVAMALCSIYYLEEDGIRRSLRILHRIARECWLQANVWTPRESNELAERSSVEYLRRELTDAGFEEVTVIAPKGYRRPLLIGRKKGAASV